MVRTYLIVVLLLGLLGTGYSPRTAQAAGCSDGDAVEKLAGDILIHCDTGIQFGPSHGQLDRQIKIYDDKNLGVVFAYRNAAADHRFDVFVYPSGQEIEDYAFSRGADPKSFPVLFQEFRDVIGGVLQVHATAELQSANTVSYEASALQASLTVRPEGARERVASMVLLTSVKNHFVKVRYSIPASDFDGAVWGSLVADLLHRVTGAAGR